MTEQLLLPSFSIRGYRGFEALDIERLGRVNLLVGRNAVGKTSVLEAIELWAGDTGQAARRLAEILSERQEIELVERAGFQPGRVSWSRAFHGGHRWGDSDIRLGFHDRPEQQLTFRQEFGQWQVDETGNRQFKAGGPPPERLTDAINTEYAISVFRYYDAETRPVALQHALSFVFQATLDKRPPLGRLYARGMSPDVAPKLWDRVSLTDSDGHVLDAMRLIIPDIERLIFVEPPQAPNGGQSISHRIPMVKRRGGAVEPLRSFGDGVIRLLDLTLALVSVQGGLLLVDEIENGVHYAVLPDLWRLVFAVAAKLDIQVVAATHSWDCIKAFQEAAVAHASEGMVIRLERDAHGSRAKVFDEDDLTTVTRAEIDVR